MFVIDDIILYTGIVGGMTIAGEVAAFTIKKLKNKNDKLASAEFGKIKDLIGLLGAEGVQLSKSYRLSQKISYEGICIIGPTGSGKSSTIMASNLLNDNLIPGSFVVSDPKGELWKICSNYLTYKGFKCIMFNPTSPLNSYQYNPLEACRTTEEVTQLAETILLNGDLSIKLQSGRSSNNGEWIQMSVPLLAASLLYCKSIGYPLNNISHALKLLINNPMESIDMLFKTATEETREQYSIFKTAAKSEKTASSILITLSSSLKLFLDSNVIKTTMKTDFKGEMLRKDKIALFICIPERKADTYSPLTATIYSQLINQSMDYTGNPITWFWDEFANIGLIPSFTKIVSTTRSREMSFVVCLQDLSQLINIYGRSNAMTILNNLKVKCCMNGLSDMETLEYISNLCGETEILTSSSSKTDSNRASTTESHQRRKLITADEVRRLEADEILLIMQNRKPIKDEVNTYYTQPKYISNIIKSEFPIV
jgi:type IV secretion system protein VirD4